MALHRLSTRVSRAERVSAVVACESCLSGGQYVVYWCAPRLVQDAAQGEERMTVVTHTERLYAQDILNADCAPTFRNAEPPPLRDLELIIRLFRLSRRLTEKRLS